ncbi:unnamed protein product [Rotaria magnacalcarata]|nr:unnamed protein product [Rotaria magnacalcarata]CAF2199818.1 unnamed protein product [Rotaria magnacalcarata]CAF3945952.1 unnamed protein product [Rotaria magnacalcarata]CAF4022746.1 unnamed protein product [Rotaria magnacalcarata]CAF4098568.1 unnamed protein product [Rotaria magnacalcarata]
MDAVKVGIEKTKEATEGKKTEDLSQKVQDPSKTPSERVEAVFESGIAKMKQDERAYKVEHYKNDYIAKAEHHKDKRGSQEKKKLF